MKRIAVLLIVGLLLAVVVWAGGPPSAANLWEWINSERIQPKSADTVSAPVVKPTTFVLPGGSTGWMLAKKADGSSEWVVAPPGSGTVDSIFVKYVCGTVSAAPEDWLWTGDTLYVDTCYVQDGDTVTYLTVSFGLGVDAITKAGISDDGTIHLGGATDTINAAGFIKTPKIGAGPNGWWTISEAASPASRRLVGPGNSYFLADSGRFSTEAWLGSLTDVNKILTQARGDVRYYTKTESGADTGTINSGGGFHWKNLVGVPAGFADGTDDGGGGGITDAYDDLVADGDIGTGSNQVAAGNHNHTGTYLPLTGGTMTGTIALTNGADIDGGPGSYLQSFDRGFIDTLASGNTPMILYENVAGTDHLFSIDGNRLFSVTAGGYFGADTVNAGTVIKLPTANSIWYTNATGHLAPVTLGSSGTYLKSLGTGSAPTWDTPAGGSADGFARSADGDTNYIFTDGTTAADTLETFLDANGKRVIRPKGGSTGPTEMDSVNILRYIRFGEMGSAMALDSATYDSMFNQTGRFAGSAGTLDNLTNVTETGEATGKPLVGQSDGTWAPGEVADAYIASTIARDSELHTRSHTMTSTSDHSATAWRVFYSNGSGNVTELALGSSGTYLRANGTTSAPDWASISAGLWASVTGGASLVVTDTLMTVKDSSGVTVVETQNADGWAFDGPIRAAGTGLSETDSLHVGGTLWIGGSYLNQARLDSMINLTDRYAPGEGGGIADAYDDLVADGDIGTGSTQVAAGNHTHAQLHDRSHAITSTSDHTATAWRVFYSNGSGNVTELGLGESGTVLKSNGASSAPSFQADATGGTPDSATLYGTLGLTNYLLKAGGTMTGGIALSNGADIDGGAGSYLQSFDRAFIDTVASGNTPLILYENVAGEDHEFALDGNRFYSKTAGGYFGADTVSAGTVVKLPTNHSVWYSNGTGHLTALTLGASGTFLRSNGATSAPDWAAVAAGMWASVTGGGTLVVTDTLATLKDSSDVTIVETQNAGGFYFHDPITVGAAGRSSTDTLGVAKRLYLFESETPLTSWESFRVIPATNTVDTIAAMFRGGIRGGPADSLQLTGTMIYNMAALDDKYLGSLDSNYSVAQADKVDYQIWQVGVPKGKDTLLTIMVDYETSTANATIAALWGYDLFKDGDSVTTAIAVGDHASSTSRATKTYTVNAQVAHGNLMWIRIQTSLDAGEWCGIYHVKVTFR